MSGKVTAKLLKPCKPFIGSLGYTLKGGEVGRQGYSRPGTVLSNPTLGLSLEISTNFAMGCCSAAELSKFYSSGLDDKAKADFLLAFLPFVDDVTFYAIPSTSQMPGGLHPSPLVALLMEIGMKQVDVRPNRIHGPNNMHLMVLDPEELILGNIEKYLHRYSTVYESWWMPNYLKGMPTEQQQLLFKTWSDGHKNAEIAAKRAEITLKQEATLAPLRAMTALLYYGDKQLRNSSQQVYSSEVLSELTKTLNKYGWHHDSENQRDSEQRERSNLQADCPF